MTISEDKLNSLPEPPGGGGLPFLGETIAFFPIQSLIKNGLLNTEKFTGLIFWVVPQR